MSMTVALWLSWGMATILFLATAILAVLLWRRWRADEGAEKKNALQDEAMQTSRPMLAHLRREVRRALRILRTESDSGDDPYAVPWIVVLGTAGAQTREIIDAIDPDRPAIRRVVPHGGSIHFCRQGIVFHAGDLPTNANDGLQKWNRLIRLMTDCRPRRPADGLAVMLPMAMLYGPDAMAFDRLADCGSQLGEMIASAQRLAGLKLPVTLTFCGCQNVCGFPAFASALPESALADALGWTPDFSDDGVFRTEWADEAAKHVATKLTNAIIQQLMTGVSAAAPDELLQLPAQVRAIAPRLKSLMAAMFQPTAYREPFLFRGFYLVGTQPGQAGRGMFVSGLFNRKIFQEGLWVQPIKGSLTMQTRRLRLAQALLAGVAAISLTGLIWLQADISARADQLHKALTAVAGSVRMRNEIQDRPPESVRAEAVYLLQSLSGLDVQTLTTPLAPTSYLYRPDKTAQRALAVGVDAAAVAIDRRLRERLIEILDAPAPEGSESEIVGQVNGYVARLAEFDRMLQTFRAVPAHPSPQALNTVAGYALAFKPKVQNRSKLYRRAIGLANIPTGTASDATGNVSSSLQRQFAAAFRARFDGAGLLRRLERIDRLTQMQKNETPDAAMARLRELLFDLQRVERDLNSPDYGWINRDAYGPDFNADLARLGGLSIVDATDIAALRRMGEKQIADARDVLFAQMADDRAPLLHMEGSKVALSPQTMTLRQQLQDFLNRPFMTETMPGQLVLPPAGRPIQWDPYWLTMAQRLTDDYATFAANDEPKFPATLAFSVETVAYDQARQRIEMALAAAMRPADIPAGRQRRNDEIRNMTAVGQNLIDLSAALHKAGIEDADALLRNTVLNRVNRQLAAIDAKAAGQLLLAKPSNFEWWDGNLPLSLRAFHKNSLAELAFAVKKSHETIVDLTHREAEPLMRLIAAIADGNGDMETMERWQSIARAVARYERNDRASSLRQLEQFILIDMDKVDLSDCAAIAPLPLTPQSDPFTVVLTEMKSAITKRCIVLGWFRLRKACQSADLGQRQPYCAAQWTMRRRN